MPIKILHSIAYCHDCREEKKIKGFSIIAPGEPLIMSHGILSGQLFDNCRTHHDKQRHPEGKGPKHDVFTVSDGMSVVCDMRVSSEMIAANVKIIHKDYLDILNQEIKLLREGGASQGMRK